MIKYSIQENWWFIYSGIYHRSL